MVALLALATFLFAAGCTNARISRNLSAGAVGCPANSITIVDETATASGTHTWTAQCAGKTFVCSFKTSAGTNCKESRLSIETDESQGRQRRPEERRVGRAGVRKGK